MSKLDQQENEILEVFEAGEVKQSKNATETQQPHQEYAQAVLKKDARIFIRLSSKDLRWL